MEVIEPWGQLREDWRTAKICHTIVRCHAAAGDGKIFGADSEPKDFLLAFERRQDEPQQTDEAELLAYFRALGAS